MEKPMEFAKPRDAVDWFTTEVLRNPERAADLKHTLRQEMGLSNPPDALAADSMDADDVEDLWDNVPV